MTDGLLEKTSDPILTLSSGTDLDLSMTTNRTFLPGGLLCPIDSPLSNADAVRFSTLCSPALLLTLLETTSFESGTCPVLSSPIRLRNAECSV